MPADRPAVSVVLPFHGTTEQAKRALDALAAIDRRDGDEVLVADNSGTGAMPRREGVTVLAADDERSAYYARNVAASAARNEWLLLLDADCRPRADILDRYFDEPVDPRCGALVGEVEGEPQQDELVARYARSRGHLTQGMHFRHGFRPFGVTANLMIRRAAWEDVGGFHEGVRSGGDVDFSWRLQDAGWTLAYRPAARARHAHRSSARALARQAARYAAGRAWLRRRYPGSLPRPTLLPRLAACAAGVFVWGARGHWERALYKALDGVYVASEWAAYFLSNTPSGGRADGMLAPVVVVASLFPDRDAPGTAEIARRLGARVEAAARPVRADRSAARTTCVAYAEDDGLIRRAAAVARLSGQAPRRVGAYVVRRRRRGWPPLAEVAVAAQRLRATPPAAIRPAGDEAARRRAEALAQLCGHTRLQDDAAVAQAAPQQPGDA